MYSGFRYNICVESVAEVDRVDIITGGRRVSLTFERYCHHHSKCVGNPYHSKSLYIIVKKTCRKRLTAFMRTAKR